MRIATWNVNSVRARLDRLVPWLQEHRPDVVCLQETKVADELFPYEFLEDCGYNVTVYGQKTYNGVAVLARHGIEAVVKGFPGAGELDHRRLLACVVEGVVIVNVYVPNGQAVGTDKYRFKLDWLARLRRFLDEHHAASDTLVLCGDCNVTFDDRDVHDPVKWRGRILCSEPEREALRHVMGFGLHDALRKHHTGGGLYTWWDLRTRGFERNDGLRIDHFLVSAPALERCTDVEIHTAMRAGRAPSDHVPLIATFDL